MAAESLEILSRQDRQAASQGLGMRSLKSRFKVFSWVMHWWTSDNDYFNTKIEPDQYMDQQIIG